MSGFRVTLCALLAVVASATDKIEVKKTELPHNLKSFVGVKAEVKRTAVDLRPRHHEVQPKKVVAVKAEVEEADPDLANEAETVKVPAPHSAAQLESEVDSADEDLDADPKDEPKEPLPIAQLAAEPKPQPKAQPVAAPKPSVETTEVVISEAKDLADSDTDSDDEAKQLKQELSEAQQRRANVGQLEKALAADIALLREGTALRKVSVSKRGRAAAEKQVRESEHVVKDTEGMLRESREAAAEDARAMLREAAEVRAAAEGLANEAKEQLHLFAISSKPVKGDAEAPAPKEVAAAPKEASKKKKAASDIEDLDDDA